VSCFHPQVGLDLITAPVKTPRKTKIVCTLGPSCWSEEGLAALIDAGMNVARFNFSHGDHAGHLEVLERVRKVKLPECVAGFETRARGGGGG
jgi:pyruvate kinase